MMIGREHLTNNFSKIGIQKSKHSRLGATTRKRYSATTERNPTRSYSKFRPPTSENRSKMESISSNLAKNHNMETRNSTQKNGAKTINASRLEETGLNVCRVAWVFSRLYPYWWNTYRPINSIMGLSESPITTLRHFFTDMELIQL